MATSASGTGINVNQTAANLLTALRTANSVGINWPYPNLGPFEGPVDVTVMRGVDGNPPTYEVGDLADTPYWNLNFPAYGAVFRITFQGEVHNSFVSFAQTDAGQGHLRTAPVTLDEIQEIAFTPIPNPGNSNTTSFAVFFQLTVNGKTTPIMEYISPAAGAGAADMAQMIQSVFERSGICPPPR